MCKAGQDNYCVSGSRFLGVNRPGAYSTHVLVPDPKYLVDAAGIDEAFAATLACSGVTAYSASAKLPPLAHNDRVAVIGCGGVGLAGIAVLRAKGVKNIVACDIDDAKLATAAKLGAKFTVNPKAPDAPQKLQGIAGAIDFVGTPGDRGARHCRAAQGRALCTGRPARGRARTSAAADRAAGDRHRRLLRRQPAGAEGGRRTREETQAQASAGRDAAGAAEANGALEDLKAGRVLGRVVLDFERVAP